MRKRYLSILVACAMLLTSAPTAAFAEEPVSADAMVAEEVTTGNDIDAEDIAPAGDNSATTEQVQSGEVVSDEAAENPADEVEMIADEEQSIENASESEIAEETGEEFVDGTGLISEIEVVEDESVAKTIETASVSEANTIELNVPKTIEFTDSDPKEYTLAVGQGSYLMVITDYTDYTDYEYTEHTVNYEISPSEEEDFSYGAITQNKIEAIYCLENNSTISFTKSGDEDTKGDKVSFTVILKEMSATSLQQNSSASVTLATGEYRVYRIQPSVTGRYTMYMEGEDIWDVLISVYVDSFRNPENIDCSSSITRELIAGKTYYYLVQRDSTWEQKNTFTIHFLSTPTVTAATLITPPTKREYVKEQDWFPKVNGMKIKLTYSNGSSNIYECRDFEESYLDNYNNSIVFKAYDKDIKGNIDYSSELEEITDDYPSGIYYMGADIREETDDRSILLARVTVPFTIVNKGQHIHLWGAWTNTATGQSRKCELCGATETKSTPVLELTANKLTMKKGQTTKKFKVTKMIAGDSLVSVKSSDKKTLKVSNVKPDGTFKLKALKVTGKKKVKLTITLASGLSKTIKVTIQNAKVKTTKVKTDKKLTLQAKKKAKLKSVITPVTSQDKVKYKSSNKKVATVNAKGVVTAKKPGKAKITIQSGNKKATCTVTVQKK